MPDSEPPRGDLTPDELDLLRRMAKLQSETVELLADVRERVRSTWELLQVAEHFCDSVDWRGAVTPARPPARSR
jgi:hypothetical protein